MVTQPGDREGPDPTHQTRERITVGRYRVLELIRRKGFASYYRAVDEENGGLVMLRIVPVLDETARSPHLLREFEIGQQLLHSAIPEYFDFLRTGDVDCLVTEFVEGPSLLDALPRGEATGVGRRAKNAFRQLQEALDYLHGEGLVHANLAPANLRLAGGDRVMLVDLGHCERVESSEPFWHGEFHGTPAYSSPEHFTRELKSESDYFVVGVLLVEHLTGRPAIRARDFGALLEELKELRGVAARLQGLDGELREALLSLLSWVTRDRRIGWEALASVVKSSA